VGSGEKPLFALFAEPIGATADLIKRFKELLDPNIRTAFSQDGIWLVRSDGYVACSANDAEIIADYLDGLIGSSKHLAA
jgi:hypothetical protein